jgi:predicted Rossmann-fold nucleotide-binding protein
LRQTRKASRVPIVLIDEGYWREVVSFDKLIEYGMIDPADLTLFRFADNAEGAWDALIEQGLRDALETEEDEDLARDM